MPMHLLPVVFMAACPCLALLITATSPKTAGTSSARIAGWLAGIALLCSLGLTVTLSAHDAPLAIPGIALNRANLVLCSLIFFVSFVVQRFSLRYMDGDSDYKRFFYRLQCITLSATLMVISDNLMLFWISWVLSNLFLVQLMIHHTAWSAARESGARALRALLPGSLFLLCAIMILGNTTGTWRFGSLHTITTYPVAMYLTLSFIAASALTQSACWPFQRWLLSSLNAPTPVSALMHAGIVNGGGILIVKFSPLFEQYPAFLMMLFIPGTFSALAGTFWKLIQTDMKRMLACSTMAQMGFMIMQCGLGLYAAAIVHLCWHGLFKAYLFLTSGSAIAQKRINRHETTAKGALVITLAISAGVLAALGFAYASDTPLEITSTSVVLLVFAAMAGAQIIFAITEERTSLMGVLFGFALATAGGIAYGAIINLIKPVVSETLPTQGLALNRFHVVILLLFIACWAFFNSGRFLAMLRSQTGGKLYVWAMNASQPAPETITAIRTDYPAPKPVSQDAGGLNPHIPNQHRIPVSS